MLPTHQAAASGEVVQSGMASIAKSGSFVHPRFAYNEVEEAASFEEGRVQACLHSTPTRRPVSVHGTGGKASPSLGLGMDLHSGFSFLKKKT